MTEEDTAQLTILLALVQMDVAGCEQLSFLRGFRTDAYTPPAGRARNSRYSPTSPTSLARSALEPPGGPHTPCVLTCTRHMSIAEVASPEGKQISLPNGEHRGSHRPSTHKAGYSRLSQSCGSKDLGTSNASARFLHTVSSNARRTMQNESAPRSTVPNRGTTDQIYKACEYQPGMMIKSQVPVHRSTTMDA
jgi:hypothetical protein